jgi:hypothetical protein
MRRNPRGAISREKAREQTTNKRHRRGPPSLVTAQRTPRMPASRIPDEPIDLQFADVLREVRWPANKDDLVDAAREAGASNEVLAILDGMPEQDYHDVASVTRLIGSNFGPGISV